jgi:hypothetical protein
MRRSLNSLARHFEAACPANIKSVGLDGDFRFRSADRSKLRPADGDA